MTETIQLKPNLWTDLVYSEDEGVWYAQLFGRNGVEMAETGTHDTRDGALAEARKLAKTTGYNDRAYVVQFDSSRYRFPFGFWRVWQPWKRPYLTGYYRTKTYAERAAARLNVEHGAI